MAKEIETAYHVSVRELPDLDGVPYRDIEQVYFTPADEDSRYPEISGAEWRIRRTTAMDGEVDYSTTVKIGDKRLGSRIELEASIPDGAFGTRDDDIQNHAYGVVRKRRYDLGDDLVLDVYDPEYHGLLVLAEKEFASSEEQGRWQPPNWCLPSDDIPSNRQLAAPMHPSRDYESQQEENVYSSDEIRAVMQQTQGMANNRVVTVSGISGSGKSTLARQLASDLDAPIVETDHLHVGATKLLEQLGVVNHDLPHAYDYAFAGWAALKLVSGEMVKMPQYDYESAEPTGSLVSINPSASGNVVVDGLYASRIKLPDAAENVDTRHILLDTPLYASVLRRLLRDTGIVGDNCERPVQFSPEESLQYVVATALPTYLQHCDMASFDYIVR